MADQSSTTDILNQLLGGYWTASAQHLTRVALLESWGISGLANTMRAHIDDEPASISALTDRLVDIGGRPDFTLGQPNIATTLREVLENDLALQRGARTGLNAAAEAVAAGHDATTRVVIEAILAAEE
jgi:bacterioferritin